MDAGRTISAVAARTGFRPSTLRFYEDAGLLAPARSEAGYRVYDDRTVERIRFIGRAKQLGLSLDDIAALIELWDGARCATVAGRLGALVDDKIRETQERIAGLVAFVADLERARAGLGAADDEPCGDGCACHDHASRTVPVDVALVRKPSTDPAALADARLGAPA